MPEAAAQPTISGEGTSENSLIPNLGMSFESDEKAYQFYCFYAREMGFGVRKHLVKRRSNGTVYARTFCCYKEGFCRTLTEGKKPRPDARTGCGAHIDVRLLDDDKFHVTEFQAEHNHDLVRKPSEIQLESVDNSVAAGKARKWYSSGEHLARKFVLKTYFSSDFANSPHFGQGEIKLIGENVDNEDWVPKIDMEFEDDDEAYEFYSNYAARIGFSVRKHLVKRRTSGLVYSRTYVCHKEGQSRKSNELKKDQQHLRGPKPYDRTGCASSMTIKIMKNGRYRVTEVELKHNHPLVIPSKAHLFRWRWRRGLVGAQADSIGSGDIRAAAFVSSDNTNSSSMFDGYTNYAPVKHITETLPGDVGAMLQYVQEKQEEDPSFYYALHLDQNERLSCIFWADAKSMVDFECFGDVLCLDTTYKYRDFGRPFVPFVGVNNHKETISFGAAMMYDETEESFKWLFETFKAAMCGKQPNVLLTDRSDAISNAVAVVWPGTTHRICVWHMYNDAIKHLNFIFQGSTTFAKDFSRCMYDVEDVEDFMLEWTNLVEKYDLSRNSWLTKLYEDREKWCLVYGRQTFYADIKSSLVKESFTGKLKDHLCSERNMLDFCKHYERELNERRHVELEADFRACHSYGKMPASKIMRQAANAYTSAVLKIFQSEFELSMDLMVYNFDHVQATYIYKVKAEDNTKEYIVSFNPSDNIIICSCRKFDFMGIQCRHVLKVLDIINIKELPLQYILKRWTKDAKNMNLRSMHEIEVGCENKSALGKRYSRLQYICNRVAVRAAETDESYAFIETLSNELMNQVCNIQKRTPPERPQAS
ncbi:Protein FAR1-RELATED SEQUENCE 7 [Platanthera zijinensis]|uniref:Protein FAR1-RELATED SEQUENCE n=1 Tax=Platanthera zijinensis TaxID=2320716 RepID=A0AAP0BA40_9ASPA